MTAVATRVRPSSQNNLSTMPLKAKLQPDLLDVPCSLCFLISVVQDTRFNFAWDDCIPEEIANNAYAIICFFGGGGGGGGGGGKQDVL